MNNPISHQLNALLLLGPTGAGKSPLGDTIHKNGLFHHACHHLDFGSELRDAVSLPDRSALYSSEELYFIHGVLERGLLLENEHFVLAEKIIKLFLKRVAFSPRHILILNGIPRHKGQADDISRIVMIHALIVLDCTADDVFFRISKNTGGDRTGRIDDERNLIEKKLIVFREKTTPLISYYKKKNASLYRVSVTGTMTSKDTYERVSRLAAAHPPVSLVTKPPQR